MRLRRILVNAIEMDITRNQVDTTTFQSGGWHTFIPGLERWSVRGVCSKRSRPLRDNNEKLRITIRYGKDLYIGNAYVSGYSVQYGHEVYEFRGSGPLTLREA